VRYYPSAMLESGAMPTDVLGRGHASNANLFQLFKAPSENRGSNTLSQRASYSSPAYQWRLKNLNPILNRHTRASGGTTKRVRELGGGLSPFSMILFAFLLKSSYPDGSSV
jgi:hypothetical protein